jgi:hypothetical protein
MTDSMGVAPRTIYARCHRVSAQRGRNNHADPPYYTPRISRQHTADRSDQKVSNPQEHIFLDQFHR